MAFRLTLWLASVFVGLLGIKTITGDRTCEYHKKNYTECTVMLYTKWTPCNGTDCDLGLQKRYKGICCPASSKNDTLTIIKDACKRNCNISDSDFYELKNYTPPSTILTPKASSPAVKTNILLFSPTSLAMNSDSSTEPVTYSQTSSGTIKTDGSTIPSTSSKIRGSTIPSTSSKTHGSTIPSTSNKMHGSTIPSTSSQTHGSIISSTSNKIRGSTVHSALGKAHDSTVVSLAEVKSTTTSTRATQIKGSQINSLFVLLLIDKQSING